MNDNEPFESRVTPTTGVVVVDHGSRREESNALLLEIVAQLRERTGWKNVQPAHMELAEPTIEDAFARCVANGATRIVVHPYFLGPGRHWNEDIPNLSAKASEACGGTPFVVTPPLGPHSLLLDLIQVRVEEQLADAAANRDAQSP